MKKELSIFAFFFFETKLDFLMCLWMISNLPELFHRLDDVRLIIIFCTMVFEENELPTWTCNAILKAINGCLLCLLYCAYMRWLLSSMDFHPTHPMRECVQEKILRKLHTSHHLRHLAATQIKETINKNMKVSFNMIFFFVR
jgi:hypothetical protein